MSAPTAWDAITRARGAVEPDLQATVTEEAPVVRLRDALEKAHLDRVLPLTGGERVLDLGGGAGRIAVHLAPRVAEVLLVEPSAALAAIARRRAADLSLDNLHVASMGAFDVDESERFDLIVVFGVATHLSDDGLHRLAERVARMLRPGGRLVLKEPVSVDGLSRQDHRADGYLACFRPREAYIEAFGRWLPLSYHRPTCAHLIPAALLGTQRAAQLAGRGALGRWLDRLRPLYVAVDPVLQRIEDGLRGHPFTAGWLAPVPVVQDLYLFDAPAAPSPEPTARPPALRPPELSVVVIAFNEEACVQSVVEELIAVLSASPADSPSSVGADIDRARLAFEVVLVDDGSTDSTLAHLHALRSRHPSCRVVRRPSNGGIGAALRAGFDAAEGRYLTWVPADGQLEPSLVVDLYRRRKSAPMLTTVYAQRADPLYRHALSKTLNALIRWRTGVAAQSGGNYLFERALWEVYAPREDDTMMLSTAFRQRLRRAGIRIAEVPTRARKRRAGHSKVLNPRTIARTLRATLQLVHLETTPKG